VGDSCVLSDQGLLGRWSGGVRGHLKDQHVGWVVAERDAVFFEGEDDATTEFAEDAVALVGADTNLDGVGDGAAFNLVDAEDNGVGDGDVFEDGVVADVVGYFAQERDYLVGVGAGVDADLKGCDGEVAGEVGDGGYLAVGNDVEGAVAVAECGTAEGEVFNCAFESGENDNFADVVLIFDEDEDAVDHVLEDGLRAEADADTDDSCGSQDGLVGDVEDVQDLKEGDKAKHTVGGRSQDGGYGAELGGMVKVANLTVGAGAHLLYKEQDDALEDKDDQKDDDYFWQLILQEKDDVVVPIKFDDLKDALVLRGYSQKMHDYYVSLSRRVLRTECVSCL